MTAWRRSTSYLGWQARPTSVVKYLLAANISVYILGLLLSPMQLEGMRRFLGLVPDLAVHHLHLWQFLTYMFLHGGFWHLGFNMLALWMFGTEIEALWGRRIFLQYYLFSGLGGSIVYTLASWGSPVPMIGASGAIFGLLLAYALLFPDRRILLYFFFPIKAKYFVAIYGALTLFMAQQPNTSGIAHFAHLGGLLFGFIYLQSGMYRSRLKLSNLGRAWRRRQARSRMRIVRPDEGRPADSEQQRQRVDQILEKISRQGLQSLTREEQEILRRASRKH